ncbi:MAG: biotin--[acetyl-CoA-carboxylase] ligase [Treponema sp.]|nr:biotin--[acetyl-CoA-carboxylase] ligase [Treponema sp.]
MSTKEKVLENLKANKGMEVSGQQLADYCDVSRAAIWKAVNSLRQEGYEITGSTNGGYILSENSDVFNSEVFGDYLKNNFTSLAEVHYELFSEIDSTNTYAKRLLNECGNLRNFDGTLTSAGKKYHKSIIVAESQTAGRGRLGRNFVSPAKTGIYLTVIFAPEGGITNPPRVTASAPVAVCRAIEKLYGIETSIKWINDIFAGGKKISGILTEGSANFETRMIESAIIGIGINIVDNPEVFGSEVSKIAGGILTAEDIKDNKISRCALAAEVAGNLIKILEEPVAAVMKEYKEKSFLLGQTIEVHPVIGDEKSVYKAKAVDIDEEASLVVETESGDRRTLISGEVSLKSSSFGKAD